MTLWVRAVFAVALLVAVPIVLLALFGGLVAIEVAAASHSVGRGLLWAFVTVPAALVLIRGLRVLTRKTDTSAVGVPLTEREHPELWGFVRRIAVVAGTRAPDEIYLTADANASVREESRLLGLVSTRRRMLIGAPLITCLREDQLAAILTHELAHYSNRDTRLSALTYRGRRAFTSTIPALNQDIVQRLMAVLLAGFMSLYLRASNRLSRRQELAADEAATRAVGSAVAADALRELATIVASWRMFMTNHLVRGWDAGYLPADAFAGHDELRRSMTGKLDRIRRNPPEESTPHDTHPPITARVAAIEAMRAEPVLETGRREGISLLRHPASVLDAALMSGLVPQALDKTRVDWATLAEVHGRSVASAIAEPVLGAAATLTGRGRTLRNLLNALDLGRIAELSATRPDAELGPRARRERARLSVHKGLTAAVQVALADAGMARWALVWPSLATFTADEPYATELPALIEAAVADRGDTTGLRALLAAAKVDLDRWRNSAVDPQAFQPVRHQEQTETGPHQGGHAPGHDD